MIAVMEISGRNRFKLGQTLFGQGRQPEPGGKGEGEEEGEEGLGNW